jgi:hypothetical protein
MFVLFWLNAVLAVVLSIAIYLTLLEHTLWQHLLLLIGPQVVDAVLLRRKDDTNLDLSSLPYVDCWSICWEPGVKNRVSV